MKKLFIAILILFLSLPGISQDQRTLETRVADLLARMPVPTTIELKNQMEQMTLMGPEGRQRIIEMIVPPGTGNDTPARFAIESYSRYLSEYGHKYERLIWEEEIIESVHASDFPAVKAFFLSQLGYIGSKRSVELASGFLTDKELCEPAVAVIAASDSPDKEDILSMSLRIESLPCKAAVLNALADMQSDMAVTDFVALYARGDVETRAAALNAMAESGHPLVAETLRSAAESTGYSWGPDGATSSLLVYARNIADKGEVNEMEKICREVFSRGDMQYKIASLEVIVDYHGYEAIESLRNAFARGDKELRMAALHLSDKIPGKAATRRWMQLISEVDEVRGSEIITMLGERGDMLAVETIETALFSSSPLIRTSSAMALAKLQGKDAVPELIDYIRSYVTAGDQEAGYHALQTLLDPKRRDMIADALVGSGMHAKATMLILLAQGGENRFFNTIFEYTSSNEEKLRAIAFSELKSLAEPVNQEQLISKLLEVDNETEIRHVQEALSRAASMIDAEEDRATAILEALAEYGQQEKYIPVLARLGGSEALKTVLTAFENGSAEIRTIAFSALNNWVNHEASSALFEICKSGNKNYSDRAFYSYIRMVSEANIPDNQKFSSLKKIMPYAVTPDHKKMIIRSLSDVRTYPAVFFTAEFLDDEELKQEAARAVILMTLPVSGLSDGLKGERIKEVLSKAADIIEGPESEYQKERVRKYLEEMDLEPVGNLNGN